MSSPRNGWPCSNCGTTGGRLTATRPQRPIRIGGLCLECHDGRLAALPPEPELPESQEALDRCRDTTLTAMRRCVTAGLYPSSEALRRHGARGDNHQIVIHRDDAVKSGAVVLPPEMMERWRNHGQLLAAPEGRRGQRRARHCVSTVAPPVVVLQPNQPGPGTLGHEIATYRAAWRRIRRLRSWHQELSETEGDATWDEKSSECP